MKLVSIETKADYLKLLDYLEEKTKYVEVLRLLDDTESHFIIEKYRSRLVTEKKYRTGWILAGKERCLNSTLILRVGGRFLRICAAVNRFFIIVLLIF